MSAKRKKKKTRTGRRYAPNAGQTRASTAPPVKAPETIKTAADERSLKAAPRSIDSILASWTPIVSAAATVVLVVITGLYTRYAYQQVVETRRALTITERNFVRDERPYLMVDSASNVELYPGIKGKTPQLLSSVFVANYGKSPAFKVSFRGMLVTDDDWSTRIEQFFRDEIPSPETASKSVVAPGVPAKPELAPLWKTIPSDVLTPAKATRLMKTDNSVFVLVRLRYEDFEGNAYITDFCASHLPMGPNQNCVTHNEVK
jgi:hypothetical protein